MNKNDKIREIYDMKDSIAININFCLLSGDFKVKPQITLHNEHGIHVFNALNTNEYSYNDQDNEYSVTAIIPSDLLNEGVYYISLYFLGFQSGKTIQYFNMRNALSFQISDELYPKNWTMS